MCLDGLPLVHHRRTMLKVAQPERVAVLSGPPAANLLCANAQLEPCGSFATKVAIES